MIIVYGPYYWILGGNYIAYMFLPLNDLLTKIMYFQFQKLLNKLDLEIFFHNRAPEVDTSSPGDEIIVIYLSTEPPVIQTRG